MIDPATIAVIAIPAFAAGCLFMAWMRGPAEIPVDVTRPGDDAFTIARLTEELTETRCGSDLWRSHAKTLKDDRERLEAENRDLHTDIESKRKRLADAGLQEAGGGA